MSASAPLPAPGRPAEHGARAPGRLRPLPSIVDRKSPEVTALDARAASAAVGRETSIRVLIAAGQALVRAGYRAVLEHNEAIEVVAEAASGQQALELASATTPDVALLDVELPGLDVVETTAAIVSRPAFERVAVMVIALSESDERVLSALRAGAIGMLSNDAGPPELMRALEVLASGQALFSGAPLARRAPATARSCRRTNLPRRAHQPRARGTGTRCHGPQQRRDRGAACDHPADGQDARQPRPDEAPGPRSRQVGSARLRSRTRGGIQRGRTPGTLERSPLRDRRTPDVLTRSGQPLSGTA
jgi:DNA-binding NarL/FixJ family response regulator